MTELMFSPLIFVVNAIQENSPARDKFEKFIQDFVQEDNEPSALSSPEKRRISLFRPDEQTERDYDSEEDDEALQEQLSGTNHSPKSRSPFFRRGGPRLVTDHETSYARFSTVSNQFFQRARVVSVSEKYGFPPSKDPEGTNNLAYTLQAAYKRPRDRIEAIHSAATEYPLTGIVGTGWAEKHVHALPSVIVVVCNVSTVPAEQSVQDRKLYDTIEHLQYSLVPKRQCTIQIVGLMEDAVSETLGQEWCSAVALEQDHAVMSLRPNDVRKLQKAVQEASLLYYLRQVRRTKEKLYALIDDKRMKGSSPPVQLSPAIVRYCHKIAVFYEFQQKLEKSVRFMVLGYRQLGLYYLWLESEEANLGSDSKQSPGETTTTTLEHQSTDDSGGVELELTDDDDWSVFAPPSDAVFQCRAVADWFNTRLLTSGLASRSEGGLLAASNQWRQHLRVFLASPRSWHSWVFVYQQRCTWSRLLEAHPPVALSKAYDEVSIRCSPWRAFQAAAETALRLACELKMIDNVDSFDSSCQGSDRPRYLGGLSADTLRVEFNARKCEDLRQIALDLIIRSIDLFEKEQQREGLGFYAEDEVSERSSCRTGAQLYYLAGGVLLGANRFSEAATHLTKGCRYARGWKQLELGIRKMLIECYENMEVTPSDGGTSGGQALVSMILDSYFNTEMSSSDLRKALGHFSSMSGSGNTLKWYHETHEEEDTSLPFSFALTFPGQTHATSGDTVAASVLINSNLDYAVHLNSVTLATLAGDIEIPAIDLMAATNASEGTGGGVIIQANTCIVITTKIELPRDVSMIAFDESGNGGELQGVSGKGSFAKNAKPRTAGITSAAGARFVSEDKLNPANANSQGWNLKFLGGKPLLCSGANLLFYPVQAEQASGSSDEITLIDLTIEKKKRRTAANIRRTAFEEENYLASAWMRPLRLPFKQGPRSLRVLGPMPDLVVTDLTSSLTNGQALEGTVNRILLSLKAGPSETCIDVDIVTSCFSVLVTPTGATKRLVSEEEVSSPDIENGLNMMDSRCRTPIMVETSLEPSATEPATGYGYELPHGYKRAGSGQKLTEKRIPKLDPGRTHLVPIEIFRPAVSNERSTQLNSEANDESLGDRSLCKTDFYVTIKYKQKRPISKVQQRNRRRSSRRPPNIRSREAKACTESQMEELSGDLYDEVELEHSGSVTWSVPLIAHYAVAQKSSPPSGIRHPKNSVHGAPIPNADQDIVAVDQRTLPLHCSLGLEPSMTQLKAELVSIRFEDNEEPTSPFTVSLCSNDDSSDIFRAKDSSYPILSNGMTFGATCSLVPCLKGKARDGEQRAPLGCILADWNPVPFNVDEIEGLVQQGISNHGPLILPNPCTSRFPGPLCNVERAPFDVFILDVTPQPTVGVPFDVAYKITNKTRLHQTIDVRLNGAIEKSLLLSGIIGTKLTISPFDQESVSFVFVCTAAGRTNLPSLRISSDRFDSWIVNFSSGERQIFVFP